MKRVTLILATFALLCLAGGQAQARGPHGPHGPHGHHGHRGYHGRGGVVVHAPVVRPRVFVHPPVYAPVYRPRYYYQAPYYGFSYRGRGVSVSVGF